MIHELNKVIGALRCSNIEPEPSHTYCEECPYNVVRRLPFEIRDKADFWLEYEPYHSLCNRDKIQKDAISLLEHIRSAIYG